MIAENITSESIKTLDQDIEQLNKEIILIILKKGQYPKIPIEILKILVNEMNQKGIYITVTRGYDILKKLLEENQINTNNLFFIDMISDKGKPVKEENCIYVNSPKLLTEVSIFLSQLLSSIKEEKFIFFDSLSTLHLYHESGTISKFSHFLTNKLRESNVKAIILSLEKELNERLINQLSQFCDKTIEVE